MFYTHFLLLVFHELQITTSLFKSEQRSLQFWTMIPGLGIGGIRH